MSILAKAGVLILAGGQGTRLGYEGPKGIFPILDQTSLFEWFVHKVIVSSSQVGYPLSMCIMTSHENDAQTRQFFRNHGYFGIDPEQMDFIIQDSLPFLNEARKPLPYCGPAGNGWALRHLVEQGILQKWERRGIQAVNVIPIDNPLADPFELGLIAPILGGADIATLCTDRVSEEEKVGVVISDTGKTIIIEYSELSDLQKRGRDSGGKLLYPLAYLGLVAFSLPFIHECYHRSHEFPIHLVLKKLPGSSVKAYKQERFLFDCFPWASHVHIAHAPRESCFAPLKDADSVERVRQSIRAYAIKR